MRPTAYINGRILQDQAFHDGFVVVVSGGDIINIISHDDFVAEQYELVELEGNYLIPGFIDVQVNGGGGVLFNDSPDIDGVKTISQAHQQFGTTGMMLTLISDDLDVIQKGVSAIDAAIAADIPGILGIHIEGPFLNPDRRGIHDAGKIKKLTAGIVQQLQPLKTGRSMLTIAPETMEPALVGQLKEKGYILCAGHSNATFEQASTAIDHGVSGFTHLFNAMSQLSARAPGMVGAALDHDDTWCGIIADNHHVLPASLRIAHRIKGPQKLMLVTDAMPPVGSLENEFYLMGNRITVKDGVCVDAAGTLAGAALDMATAVRNMMQACDCSLAEASVMASSSPAAFLGLQDRIGAINPGLRANFAILDQQLHVVKTIIDGQQRWPVNG